METINEMVAPKQYSDIQNANFRSEFENIVFNPTNLEQELNYPNTCFCDEPMDLTIFSNKDIGSQNEHTEINRNDVVSKPNTVHLVRNVESSHLVNHQNYNYYSKKRRKRKKLAYTEDGKLVLVSEDSLQYPTSFSPNKQLEVLKAAKSLFSKRTRTLYHWMYPNAAKQQIKTALASSWDSLGKVEKDFYISQVLGRFGFPQTNLMVNPQLDTIKDLPPLLENIETRSKSHELQSAISSILPSYPSGQTSLTFEEFEEMNERHRKRRGRPRGSTLKRSKHAIAGHPSQDFQDDPELSQELEKFAVKFNLNKI